MSILKYLQENLNRQKLTSGEIKKSTELTDTLPKLSSKYIIDDGDIDKSPLGEYVPFDNEELNHFKTKSMIPPDMITKDSVMWDWDDEHLEDYIVRIKKRVYGSRFVYEVIQSGDAEITNKDNVFQGSDRDVYSIPFENYEFDFVHNFTVLEEPADCH